MIDLRAGEKEGSWREVVSSINLNVTSGFSSTESGRHLSNLRSGGLSKMLGGRMRQQMPCNQPMHYKHKERRNSICFMSVLLVGEHGDL